MSGGKSDDSAGRSKRMSRSRRKVNGWWVMAWNPTTMMWTCRTWHEQVTAARLEALVQQHHGLRVRLSYAPRMVAVPDSDAPPTSAAAHRQRIAGEMSDRADAMKRYKSMG